jgi:hypothetical protein
MSSFAGLLSLRLCNSMLLAAGLFHDRAGRLDLLSLFEAVAFIAMVATAGWYAATIWKRRRGDLPHRDPQRLFSALCRAHRLDRNQRRLILQLTDFYHLPQPGMLFLRPDRWDFANLSGFTGNVQEVKLLGERLFGSS